MSNENHNNYIKAISNSEDSKSHRNTDSDRLSLPLDEQSIKLIKDIKTFMEWDVDTAINSAITYFYKTSESQDIADNDNNVVTKSTVEEVKFTPTFKNKQRISREIEKKQLNEKYYIMLIRFALKSFFKVIDSKH
ncbi:hypothetical protein [Endozoicomonas sp. 4G]|uniref:hypothetical protein n=1 Tax=Endozoicomonas sp. 4G TaxID=2872754 RepID=UPI0020790B88|nr:hypothetical protein [Endozoicomonas sp. 4G]